MLVVCDGKHPSIEVPKLSAAWTKIAVTAPMSCEEQDPLEKASTAGANFFASGGGVVNTDDYFISQERRERNEKKVLAKRKDKYKQYGVMKYCRSYGRES